MKPQFENIPSNAQTSFGVKFFHLDKFTVPYHYHPAYELTLILKGNGKYRINFAVQQLLSSDRAISEIAFDCGFGDISHFHKRFKKTFKMSPLRYRQSFQAHVK